MRLKFLLRDRREPGDPLPETQQDDRKHIGHVLPRIRLLQFLALAQDIANQRRLLPGKFIPYLSDLRLIHLLDSVVDQIDRFIGDR